MKSRRHDWKLYAWSEMDEHLETALHCRNVQYCIYGDSRCKEIKYLQVPFHVSQLIDDQCAFNTAISSGRITVEWASKDGKTYWGTTDFRRKHRVLQAPVGSLYHVSLLLYSLRLWFHRNQMSMVPWKPNVTLLSLPSNLPASIPCRSRIAQILL